MRKLILVFCLVVGFVTGGRAQSVFQSSGSGNWDDPASWTKVSGGSTIGYPVSGDTATITAGAVIMVDANLQCNALTINGGSSLLFNSTASILTISNALTMSAAATINLNLGVMTVTGNANIGGASTITINQAALTVVGLFVLNAPSTAGTTLLDVEGGAFSCVGGMTVTATAGTRFAELRIGGGAVNLAGGIASVSANSHINFTGAGTLTLAGVVSIPNAGSWIPGNGRVVYFGIPGSNQTIAPLSYYRLVITGVGTGMKQINGVVTVTDSLSLLTDTLAVNTGGTLNLSDGITLVRTAGVLLSAPVFAGMANVVYNDIQRDTTGPELPAATNVLQQLTISDISGIQLGSDVTVNNNLDLQLGPLITGSYGLTLNNAAGGVGADPGVTVINGFVMGKIIRAIGASAGLRIFPLGIDNQDYRELDLNYATAPTAGGQLTVWAVDTAAPAQSGLPLADNGVVITKIAPIYWEADAGGSLAGGDYTLTLTGGGMPGVSDVNTLRIVKRPSTGGDWILDGVDGSHGGTNAAPVISRTGMAGFSQFSIGSDNSNTLPITLLSFSGKAMGNSVMVLWSTTAENNNLFFTVEHSLDGQTFTALGTVPGAGTTNAAQSYSYIHDPAPAGANYYRLKQTDADGQFAYSAVIVCHVAATSGILLYPNPATSALIIQGLTNGPVLLLDGGGRRVGYLKAGTNAIDGLEPGVYYVEYAGRLLPFVKR